MSSLLPTSLTNGALLGACVTPAAVAAAFVFIRIMNSWKVVGKFYLDDWMSIFALLCLVCLAALSYYGATLPNDPSTPLATTISLFAALQWVSPATLYFGKTPLLIMVLRVFEINRWVRINTWIVLIVPAVLFTGGAIYVTVPCSAVNKIVTANDVAKCLNTGIALGVWNGGVAIVSDLIILITPFRVVSRLKLPVNKKIGLILLFLTGIFTLATSIATLYFKGSALAGKSVNIIGSVVGALLEAAVALIVSCLPAIRAIWLTCIVDSHLYNSLFSTMTSRTKSESKLAGSTREAAYSDERGVPAESRGYIELSGSRARQQTSDDDYSVHV